MEKQLNSYSQRGLRTLAVASREFSASEAESFIARLSDVSVAFHVSGKGLQGLKLKE
jgi:magnesium-transporting ATPase (P-type)